MHQVFLYDPAKRMIGIGCIEWSEYREIDIQNGYTEEQIVEYKRYIDLFAESLTWR